VPELVGIDVDVRRILVTGMVTEVEGTVGT
jgi:hypothetical protein